MPYCWSTLQAFALLYNLKDYSFKSCRPNHYSLASPSGEAFLCLEEQAIRLIQQGIISYQRLTLKGLKINEGAGLMLLLIYFQIEIYLAYWR